MVRSSARPPTALPPLWYRHPVCWHVAR